MNIDRSIGFPRGILLIAFSMISLVGCDAPSGGSLPDDDNTNNPPTGGSGVDDGDPAAVSGKYDPVEELRLEADGLTLVAPPSATPSRITISILPASQADLAPLPGAVELSGGVFEPDGHDFRLAVGVTTSLSTPTIATVLPVLFFDEMNKVWVGTGGVAIISQSGAAAEFEITHFSAAGVPDPMPLPPTGESIGTLIGVAGMGVFTSNQINTDTASLLFDDDGSSLDIDIFEQTEDSTGQAVTRSLLLSATAITRVENFVVTEVGGTGSSYSGGGSHSPPEPVVGAMIMSVIDGTVHVTVYLATTQRVISGTLTGPAS